MDNLERLRQTMLRTRSMKFNPQAVDGVTLDNALYNAASAGAEVCAAKRIMFYQDVQADEMEADDNYGNELGALGRDTTHGVLGILDEAGEIAEAFSYFMVGEISLAELHQHLLEEVGDMLWFIACLAEGMDMPLVTFIDVMSNKLRQRYPEKFTPEHALNRNVAAEKLAMFGGETEDNQMDLFNNAPGPPTKD